MGDEGSEEPREKSVINSIIDDISKKLFAWKFKDSLHVLFFLFLF